MKERFTGRKQNKRKRILLSSRRSPKEEHEEKTFERATRSENVVSSSK